MNLCENAYPTPYDIEDKRKKIYYRILFYMLSKFDYLEEFKIRFEEKQSIKNQKKIGRDKKIHSLKELFNKEDILNIFSETNWRKNYDYDDFAQFAIFATYLMLFLKISFKEENIGMYNHMRDNLERIFDTLTQSIIAHHDIIGYINFLSKNKDDIMEIVKLT